MILHLSDLSQEPLHSQISRQIRAKVLSGNLVEGTLLPSIRALAREQRVSVITVQRAYEDLDREGIIDSRRGKGFYVASLTDDRKLGISLGRLRENLRPVMQDALAAGMTRDQILRVIREMLETKEARR
jgi:GntR family transcriptional regulator